MCAIVDANVVAEVFGSTRPDAGEAFFRWLNEGKGTLVVGGQLRHELNAASKNFRQWARDALLSGIMKGVSDTRVDERTEHLLANRSCKSNDSHVIALAQLSGARLLYSNDSDLHQDFDDKSLIDNPRGKVYSTLRNKNFTRGKRDLLGRRDLCGALE